MGMDVKKILAVVICKFFAIFVGLCLLSGCMTSIADGRKYSGSDSSYTSSHNAVDTSQCIKNGWQQVFANNPSIIWLTGKDVEGRYTVYVRDFIYLADIKESGSGSTVVYYHNGDHLWGTKERLISAINNCL